MAWRVSENAPVMTAWLAMIVARVARMTIGSSAHSGTSRIERVLGRGRVGEDERALSEIVDDQRREHEAEPGGADRPAAEMAEIRVERLGAGDGQAHGAEHRERDARMVEEEQHRTEPG